MDGAPYFTPYPSSAPPAPQAYAEEPDVPEQDCCVACCLCCINFRRKVLYVFGVIIVISMVIRLIRDFSDDSADSAITIPRQLTQPPQNPFHLSEEAKARTVRTAPTPNPSVHLSEEAKARIDTRMEKAALASENMYQAARFQEEFNKAQHDTRYNYNDQPTKHHTPGPLSKLFWGSDAYE
jgi:hypothetical protein